jgi:hypothetical protein
LRGAGRRDHAGQAKVDDFHEAVVGDNNVRRLDVAMHDVVGVSGAEAFGDLDGEIERFLGRNHAMGELLGKRFTFVVAHDDEELMVVGLFQPVNDANVRVIKGRGGTCFADQAFAVGVGDGNVGRKELERDRALQR